LAFIPKEYDDLPVDFAELYDPTTGQFAHESMTVPRESHTASLLPDGTVLIAGGNELFYYSGSGYPYGSYNTPPSATTEIYHPATGSFTPGPTMKQARAGHSATLLPNGAVLLVGGVGQPWNSWDAIDLTAAEFYQ
jgi:hypothetical protein